MFSAALKTFLHQLNCVAGAIFFARHNTPQRKPVTAVPRNLHHNQAVTIVDQMLPAELDSAQWQDFLATLPQHGQRPPDLFYHLLRLGDLGVLALARHDAPVDPDLLQMLTPLLVKLTEAGRACLQQEELTIAHNHLLWEQNMLHTLIDATPSILFSLDQDGRFLLSEGRGLRAINRLPGQANGQSIYELYAGNESVLEKVREAMAGQTSIGLVEANGRAYDAVYRPVVDNTGHIHGVVGAAYDVTERKMAIDTLTAVLNTIDEGVVTTDASGAIQMTNAQINEMFGYHEGELLGQPIWVLLTNEQQPDSAITDMQTFVEARQLTTPGFFLDLEGERRSGRTFPIEMRIHSFVLADQRRFTVSIRDVTERKEHDRLRDDFVSTVSHELRTPLASIMGWTETLLTEHPGPLTDLQRRFLNTVYASSVRLDKLIEEILTVSRIQRGVLRLNPTRLNPSQLLTKALTGVDAQATTRNIALSVEDAWPPDQLLDGDAERLEQVIMQLLNNAIKFSHAGGAVVVRSQLIGHTWRLEVTDRGLGVEEDELALVFQRFYRGKAARKAQIQGAGLGLYVCRAVVEAHGGEIALSSSPGTQTVVCFHIPVKGINE